MVNRAVVLTVSDRCAAGQRADRSGPTAIELLPSLDALLVHREIVPDESPQIRRVVSAWLNRADLILTTGGTGVAPRDVTPEALAPLIDRPLPGFGEVMRMRAYERNPMSVTSRSGAGIAGSSLVIWLPGSPKAVSECIEWLATPIKHVCALLRGEAAH